MTELSAELAELAAAYGVATEWYQHGKRIETPVETVLAVLAALGVDATDPGAALAAHRDERWARLLPPCVVTRPGRRTTFEVHVEHGAPAEVWIETEDGTTRRGVRQIDNHNPPHQLATRLVGEASFVLPDDLPLGYHTLRARSNGEDASCALIVTPAWLGIPDRLGDRRAWGIATQLYSVRSARSWGVGDLADLADLAAWGASHGAGFVQVNPLHAAAPIPPIEPSPYLPTSRRFVNPIYLRVEQIPEYAYLPGADRLLIEEARTELQHRLADQDLIDRDSAWKAKEAALRAVYAVPRSGGRDLAYAAYREHEGRALDDFATWCAIAEQHGTDWTRWPEPLRHPRSTQVHEFAAAHLAEVDFHRWLQWVTDEQLAATQAAARRAGMSLGIMHDLAVGVHARGADTWIYADTLARGIHVGAPPDAFNQLGQDWRQPPWRPDRLAAQAYRPFRDLAAAIVRHAGAVRVDHVIGLFRLWWIPAGRPPGDGTYVRYDHDAMIGILALEAHRAGALVVGEDLGVVEDSARAYLREVGLLGSTILWFEEDDGGRPIPAERWRDYCLASVTTHDLPPTAGYLAGDHVRLRDSLHLLTRPLDEELAADAAHRERWLAELRGRGLLAPGAGEEEVVAALHRYLVLSPARLLGVALTDAVGDRRIQNQPGTAEEYPNWRVPLTGPGGRAMPLDDVLRSDRAARLAAVMRTA
jgi:4-alpha-glucanotransferase